MQKVAAFVEKPDAKTALRYISEGLLWNSGNFLFPPALLLSEMARFEPAMAAAAEEAVAKARKTGSTVFLDAEAFGKAPAKSIDYAVMERTDKCWVVPAKFRWSDLGTWDALLDVGNADLEGNVVEGPVEIDHVRNSYVRSDGPLTAVIGVDEVVVVAMNDAVLVGHRDNLPRLKDVVQRMSDGKHRAATEHAVMHRPWGSYQDIDRGERFRAKRLTVKPSGKLSLQSHNRRAEHWVVVKGIGRSHARRQDHDPARERIDLHPDRRHPSPRQSRHRAAGSGRGPDRRLSSRKTTSCATKTSTPASDGGVRRAPRVGQAARGRDRHRARRRPRRLPRRVAALAHAGRAPSSRASMPAAA